MENKKKEIKVLYIIHGCQMGGATISFLNMITELVKYDIKPIIVGPNTYKGNTGKEFFKRIEQLNIEYHGIFIPMQIWPITLNWEQRILWPINILKLVIKILIGTKQLEYTIKTTNPDIVHTNTGVVSIGNTVAKKYNIPHVWHLREYQDKDFNWKIFPSKKVFIKKLQTDNYVITITKDILRYFHLDKNSNCKCIYNGILSTDDAKEPISKEKYFACASQIQENKGHEDVIRAFAEFYKTHKDYRLKILGFGDKHFIYKMKKLSLQLNCSEAIDWLGYKNNVKDYIRKARALIVASWFEGFGRMTAEACMLGCIPIGRNTAGTKEIIDYTGGLRFSTVGELISRMNEVVEMQEREYNNIAKCIQQRAVNAFSIEQNAIEIYKLYYNIYKNPSF